MDLAGEDALGEEPQTEEPLERKAIPDLKLGCLVRQRVERLKHQDLEHQNRIERRASSLGARSTAHRGDQWAAENLEVHNSRQTLERITRRAQCLVSVRKIKETGCPVMPASVRDPGSESRSGPKRYQFFEASRWLPVLVARSYTRRMNRSPSPIATIIRNLRFLQQIRGWRRIAENLSPRAGAFVVSSRGMKFTGKLDSHIDRQVFLYGGYEQEHITQFLSLIPRDRRDIALDVGANAGTHSLRLAQHFRKVHAFEPNSDVFAQLQQNISLNGLPIDPHEVGLGNRDEVLDFHLTEKCNAGLGTFSKSEQYDVPLRVVGQAKVVHASNYLRSKLDGRVDAIKIDTQGFELDVLQGLSDILRNHKPFIWFEVGTETLDQLDTMDVLRSLIPFDFRLLKFETKKTRLRRSIYLRPTNSFERGNYIAAPTL